MKKIVLGLLLCGVLFIFVTECDARQVSKTRPFASVLWMGGDLKSKREMANWLEDKGELRGLSKEEVFKKLGPSDGTPTESLVQYVLGKDDWGIWMLEIEFQENSVLRAHVHAVD